MMGTLIVGILLVLWLAMAIRHTMKHGTGDCSSGCGNCSSKATCSTEDVSVKKLSLYDAYRQDHEKPVS